MLSGKKTYIAVAGLVLIAVGHYIHGDTTVDQLVTALLQSGALAFIRAAVSKGPAQ